MNFGHCFLFPSTPLSMGTGIIKKTAFLLYGIYSYINVFFVLYLINMQQCKYVLVMQYIKNCLMPLCAWSNNVCCFVQERKNSNLQQTAHASVLELILDTLFPIKWKKGRENPQKMTSCVIRWSCRGKVLHSRHFMFRLHHDISAPFLATCTNWRSMQRKKLSHRNS